MTNYHQQQNPANILTALFQPEITQAITIMDNSLRDGEQAPGVAYLLEEKLENALAALEAGADLIDGTIIGLGERAGNIPLEEIFVALQVKYGRDLGIRLELLPKADEIIARAAQVQWQVHKPILGKQIFQHESGIHVHGLLANPLCYQAYPPELVGQQHQIVYGKHSGMAGIVHLLQQEHIELPHAQQLELLEKIKTAAVQKQDVSTKMVIEWAKAMLPKVDRH